MKRRIWIALIFVLLLTAAACTPRNAERALDAVEDAVEQRLDIVEDAVEDAVRITPAHTQPSAKPTGGTEEYLSREQAQTIALEHANLAAEEVTRLRAEFDMDDGVPEYNVEFRHGRLEYEYELHAVTGAIRSRDVDD